LRLPALRAIQHRPGRRHLRASAGARRRPSIAAE
jgi:hypothetical protein